VCNVTFILRLVLYFVIIPAVNCLEIGNVYGADLKMQKDSSIDSGKKSGRHLSSLVLAEIAYHIAKVDAQLRDALFLCDSLTNKDAKKPEDIFDYQRTAEHLVAANQLIERLNSMSQLCKEEDAHIDSMQEASVTIRSLVDDMQLQIGKVDSSITKDQSLICAEHAQIMKSLPCKYFVHLNDDKSEKDQCSMFTLLKNGLMHSIDLCRADDTFNPSCNVLKEAHCIVPAQKEFGNALSTVALKDQLDVLLKTKSVNILARECQHRVLDKINVVKQKTMPISEDIAVVVARAQEELNNFKMNIDVAYNNLDKRFHKSFQKIEQIRSSLCTACSKCVNTVKELMEKEIDTLSCNACHQAGICREQINTGCLQLENELHVIMNDMCFNVLSHKKAVVSCVNQFDKNMNVAVQNVIGSMTEGGSSVVKTISIDKNEILRFLSELSVQFYTMFSGGLNLAKADFSCNVGSLSNLSEKVCLNGAANIGNALSDFEKLSACNEACINNEIDKIQFSLTDFFKNTFSLLSCQIISHFNDSVSQIRQQLADENTAIQQSVVACCIPSLTDALCIKLLGVQKEMAVAINQLEIQIANNEQLIINEIIATQDDIATSLANMMAAITGIFGAFAALTFSIVSAIFVNEQSFIELIITLGLGI